MKIERQRITFFELKQCYALRSGKQPIMIHERVFSTANNFREIVNGHPGDRPEIFSHMEVTAAAVKHAGKWECRATFDIVEGTLSTLPATITVSGNCNI